MSDKPQVQTYENQETRRLSRLYDVQRYRGPVRSSMGAAESEEVARIFLSFSVAQRKLVGIQREALRQLAGEAQASQIECYGKIIGTTIDYLVDNRFAHPEMVDGADILFPTEKLLTNQGVPRI